MNGKSRCWAQGIDGWKPLEKVALFRWTLLASGSPLLNESELAATILNILIRMCQYFPSRDADGSVIRPLPRVKKALSDGSALPHIVQLLLTFDPVLVEKVATLLTLFMADNPLLSRLFNTGVFFFVLMYSYQVSQHVAGCFAAHYVVLVLQSTFINTPIGLTDVDVSPGQSLYFFYLLLAF